MNTTANRRIAQLKSALRELLFAIDAAEADPASVIDIDDRAAERRLELARARARMVAGVASVEHREMR